MEYLSKFITVCSSIGTYLIIIFVVMKIQSYIIIKDLKFKLQRDKELQTIIKNIILNNNDTDKDS